MYYLDEYGTSRLSWRVPNTPKTPLRRNPNNSINSSHPNNRSAQSSPSSKNSISNRSKQGHSQGTPSRALSQKSTVFQTSIWYRPSFYRGDLNFQYITNCNIDRGALFANVNRAVDELYGVCEDEVDEGKCREAVDMFERCRLDFDQLILRIQDQRRFELNQSGGVSWDVRKPVYSPPTVPLDLPTKQRSVSETPPPRDPSPPLSRAATPSAVATAVEVDLTSDPPNAVVTIPVAVENSTSPEVNFKPIQETPLSSAEPSSESKEKCTSGEPSSVPLTIQTEFFPSVVTDSKSRRGSFGGSVRSNGSSVSRERRRKAGIIHRPKLIRSSSVSSEQGTEERTGSWLEEEDLETDTQLQEVELASELAWREAEAFVDRESAREEREWRRMSQEESDLLENSQMSSPKENGLMSSTSLLLSMNSSQDGSSRSSSVPCSPCSPSKRPFPRYKRLHEKLSSPNNPWKGLSATEAREKHMLRQHTAEQNRSRNESDRRLKILLANTKAKQRASDRAREETLRRDVLDNKLRDGERRHDEFLVKN